MSKRKFQKTEYPSCDMDEELKCLIKARYNLLYVVTWEEHHVINSLQKICDHEDVEMQGVHIWDGATGMVDIKGNPITDAESLEGPEDLLDYIVRKAEDQRGQYRKEKSGRGPIYVVCDIFRFLEDGRLTPYIERKIRALSFLLKKTTIHVVMISPVLQLPVALQKCVTVIDYPLPQRPQLDTLVKNAKDQLTSLGVVTSEAMKEPSDEKIVNALLGLTFHEAEDALAKSVIKLKRMDIKILNDIKRQIIRKGQLLDYVCSEENMDSVGGFEGLKEFIRIRKQAFSENAKAYGLPSPKGVFLLGIQGSGKSLSALAIANELQVPMLKLDMGSMFSQYVGASEGNLRAAISMAESVAPCVLLVDEIDKALAGSRSSGDTDNGTTRRMIGYLVDWMQTKTAPVFIVACANSVHGIPPEILRKGRFDEMFFVDLPNMDEREKIFDIHIAKRGRDPKRYDIKELASISVDFSGAEIENAVVDAMFLAFSDGGREFTTEDIQKAASNMIPLARLEVMKETIDQLREESRGRMRRVNDPLYKDKSVQLVGDGSRFASMAEK